MKMFATSRHNGFVTVRKAVICGVLLAVMFLIDYAGFFVGVNNYFYDLSFRMRGFRTPSKDILIVSIDDRTLEKLGRWPIRRHYYASMINRIIDAEVIAFDIIMTEPTADDAMLAEAFRRHGKVILPVIIDENGAVRRPVPALSAYGTGHVHVEQGIDGVVREVFHTLYAGGESLPSFSSTVYEIAGRNIFLRNRVKKSDGVYTGIIQSDPMYINYCGGPYTFEHIPLVDVINGVYQPSYFRNRIVFVGVSAVGAGDFILTPFSQERKSMPGVEGQANMLNTLLNANAIRVVPQWMRWLASVLIGMVSFYGFLRLTEQRAAFFGLVMFLFTGTMTYILFSVFNVWLVPAICYFAIFFLFILAYIFKFNDAVETLDKAYMSVVPHLRWGYKGGDEKQIKRGIFGTLTQKGIQEKAQILDDVSRQLSFEKELTDRALLSDIHGVLIFNHDRNNMLVNSLAQALFKDNNVETKDVESFLNSLAPYALESIKHEEIMSKLYEEGLSFTVSLEKPFKTFYKADATPFSVNEISYLLVLLSDVTKIKELELLKGHIISVVSHELKTPLTSIHGFSEILAGRLEGKMKNFAEIIHRESERLARFLNMFLDITRIEEGRQPIRMTSVNLNDVVNEVASALKPIGDKNSTTILTDTPAKTDYITVDADLTKQCIYNLVENAIKYSPSGKDVIIRLTDSPQNMKIDIIDHGYGIKEEDVKKVFEKFFRSSSDKTKNIKGSGLGLTFVKEAVEAQGGRLTLSSIYGEGSTFSIIFPK